MPAPIEDRVNNLHNLSETVRRKIAYDPDVCEFILIAFGTRDLLLNYVRGASNKTEAIKRATRARNKMAAVLEELLGSEYTTPSGAERRAIKARNKMTSLVEELLSGGYPISLTARINAIKTGDKMTGLLEELFGSEHTASSTVTDDNLRSALRDSEGERMMMASATHHCHPPKRWDPITETCV